MSDEAQTEEAPTRLLAVAAVWLGSAYGLSQLGAPLLPRSIARALTLQSFLSGVLLLSLGLGLALSAKLLRDWRRALGLSSPRFGPTSIAVIIAPLVLVLSMYLGYKLALPTLIEEIRAGGRRAAQANTGEFGRAIVETHVATTLLWAVVLTPLVEELMFRGVLWKAIQRLAHKLRPHAPAGALDATIATLVTTLVFVALHADQPGGAGIVRVVQASVLGITLGIARQASGCLWPGIALHASFNLLTIAKTRKWFVSPGWPPPLPVPILLWQLGAAAAVVFVLWLLHRSQRARVATATAQIFVQRPPDVVFDFVIDPASIPASFHGHGPIPRAERAHITSDGGMRIGARRRIENEDGSVIEEVVVGLEPPTHHAYEIVSGIPRPLSLLVSGGRGAWSLEREGDGTQIEWVFRWHLRSGLARPIGALVVRKFAIAMKQCLIRHRDRLERSSDHADPSAPA